MCFRICGISSFIFAVTNKEPHAARSPPASGPWSKQNKPFYVINVNLRVSLSFFIFLMLNVLCVCVVGVFLETVANEKTNNFV
jgi:hypothetical protein